ncbi:sacsin N-terminal ATP-binding-like domain-containing protein [Spirillospora sp. NPDC048823]|uniref:sacsin N-terminal ATP-binding-like domain-containing protein n=1 Tax=unclassified Spirillospora TaxID=2642701 RepID=UPI0037164D8C
MVEGPAVDGPAVGGSAEDGESFGTRALRTRVLRAWSESPARFREDANTEEDFALGGYRDRVVVELAQNAADAALRAGVPGRLRLTLRTDGDPEYGVGDHGVGGHGIGHDGAVLSAANAGAALDAAGVEALSTLRASSKRDDAGAAGRFGVGFAAVVAVSDRPEIASRAAGVAWSRERARELVEGIPVLVDELARRGGHVPLLRLPFALDEADLPEIPAGFDTVVRLPLRGDAVESVRRQLGQVGAALMLALPALELVEIDVDGDARELTAEHRASGEVVINGGVWRTAEAHGEIPVALLEDRPVEERARPFWQVRWALPEDGLPEGMPSVVHAPTPSDERLDLPALLIASFPLAPDRRHVAPGALTDFLVDRVAETYVRLLSGLPATPRVLGFVPGPVGAGELDAKVRRGIRERLPEAPLLPHRMRGRDAVAVDAPAPFVEVLRGTEPPEDQDAGREDAAGEGTGGGDAVVVGLLPPEWPARSAALAALGVRRVELADVIDELAAVDREPAWWHRVYGTLVEAATDALGALPVPLAGDAGRTVRGPRGLLIADGVDPGGLDALGLRFVHPDAVHPLLTRLGAVEAGPRTVLADAAVRAAVGESFESDDPDAVAEAVLELVTAARLDPGEEPWLAELALPGDDGELYPAGELLLPESPLRDLMAEDAPFGVVDGGLMERWGAETLAATGVLDGFALAAEEDVNLTGLADEAETLELDDEDLWADDVLRRIGPQDLPPLVPEFLAVRDLELVDDWSAALRVLAGSPWRAAIVDPAHVTLHNGRRVAVPSYTAWWLSRHRVLEGRRPGEFRLGGDESLIGLYDAAPEGLDERLLLALGVRTSLMDLLDEPRGAQELLDRLGDPGRSVTRVQLGGLWTALADAPEVAVEPPDHVRAVVDGRTEVVDAADALVLDGPDVLPLLQGQPLVIAAQGRDTRLAELLDLPLAGDEVPGVVQSEGEKRSVPDVVGAVLPGAPAHYLAHERLIVDGQDVPWWTRDGEIHASGAGGLARALAWATGNWAARLLAEAVLRDPEALPVLLAEADLGP